MIGLSAWRKRRARARAAAFLQDLRAGLGDLPAESREAREHIESALARFTLEHVLELAQGLVFLRPLTPYPGWQFDADWNNPDLAFRVRRAIWARCNAEALGQEFEMDWHQGARILLHMGNDLSKQIFVGGCYEPSEMSFLAAALQPGMALVDAGAMEGIYTVLAAQAVGARGRVYAFEPSPRERAGLARNIALNRLRQVQVFDAALSDSDGVATLCIANAEHSGQNTLGGLVHDDVRQVETATVPLCRLDTVAARQGWPRLDFLKMDVEGSELRLLHGAEQTLRRLQPVILFELSEKLLQKQEATPEQLTAWLGDHDYLLYRFGPGGALEPGSGGAGDNLVASPRQRPLLS